AAEQLYRRALAIAEKTRGPDSPGVNIHLTNLARMAVERGKPGAAIPPHPPALASDERRLGKDHPQLAFHLSGLGKAYLELHRPADAVPVLARAVELWTKSAIDPNRMGETEMLLAEAIADSGGDRAKAHEQAAAALALFEHMQPPNAEWIAYIKAWQ